jgi:hypothetical protein
MTTLNPGIIVVALGGLVGLVGNLATGSNLGTPYAYVAGALVLMGLVVGVVRR